MARTEAEQIIDGLLDFSREEGVNEISPLLILKGIKVIIKQERREYLDIAEGLIDTGCNFSLEEVKEFALKNKIVERPVIDGLLRGDILAGARLICDIRDSENLKNELFNSLIDINGKDTLVKLYSRSLRKNYKLGYPIIYSKKYI